MSRLSATSIACVRAQVAASVHLFLALGRMGLVAHP